MKSNKILVASLALAGVVSSASAADIEVRMTGATAFRLQVFNALGAMGLTAGAGFTGSQNHFNFTGTLSGKTVDVRCARSGSVEGVRDLTLNNDVSFTNAFNSGTATAFKADYAFSDAFQSSTIYTTPTLVPVQMVSGKPGIAIQPFTWAANQAAWSAGVSNVTTKITDGILANGYWPLSFWTGTNTDAGVEVSVVGRNALSGTRVITLAEIGYGIFNSVQQRQFDNAGSTFTNVAFNGGYASGGSIRADLNTNTTAKAIGYIGLGDASLLTVTGGKSISWHGVNLWVGPGAANFNLELVKNGTYTFWGYEHMYKKSTLAGDVVTIFEPAFKTAMNAQLTGSTTAVKVGDMQVYRNQDGGPILPN
jgi:hypothetical protein